MTQPFHCIGRRHDGIPVYTGYDVATTLQLCHIFLPQYWGNITASNERVKKLFCAFSRSIEEKSNLMTLLGFPVCWFSWQQQMVKSEFSQEKIYHVE